jgi:hypothetical protein
VNSLILLVQVITFFASFAGLYYAFKALNNCDKDTSWRARVPLIMIFGGTTALALYLMMGGNVHWSVMIISVGVALRLFGERRKPSPSQPATLRSPRPHHP